MKIVSVIGARPQFIKCASISKELRRHHHEIIIHTGQHYDYKMNQVFFDELEIPKPDYNLGVGSGTHGYQTSEMIKGIENILLSEKPDLVLVYGDTNSTLAGALTAAKLHIRVAHVEAGLRSFDQSMPEEVNRVLTDHCSNLLFCPTQTAVDNLVKEGIQEGVHLTGDVMVDALLHNIAVAEHSLVIEKLGLIDRDYLLVTIHRASNTDDIMNLEQIVNALVELDETVVFPLHPRTEKALRERDLYGQLIAKVKVIDPLSYFDFLKLMSHAKRVLTDSGGVQKEAYILGVPCITLRHTTEWLETVEDGWNVLVGADKYRVIEMAKSFSPTTKRTLVFGSDAYKRICKVIGDMAD